MSHQMRSDEVRTPDGRCIRIVVWHQPGPHGDWRGALTRPTYALDGTQTVHVCGEAFASTQVAVTARCLAMAHALLGPVVATVH
jgi:hypothetical protein